MATITDPWVLQPLPARILLSVTAPLNTVADAPAAEPQPVAEEATPAAVDPAAAGTGENAVLAQSLDSEPVLLLGSRAPAGDTPVDAGANLAADSQPMLLMATDQPVDATGQGEMGILLATNPEETQADPAGADAAGADWVVTAEAQGADGALLNGPTDAVVMDLASPAVRPITWGGVQRAAHQETPLPEATPAQGADAPQTQVVPGLAAKPAQDVAKPANVWQDSTGRDDALPGRQADGFDLGPAR